METDPKTPSTQNRRPRRRWLMVLAGLVVVGGLSLWVWEKYLEDHIIPKRWGVVELNKIYRSGQLCYSLVHRTLEKHKIRVVIDLTKPEKGDPDRAAETQAIQALKIERARYPLKGNGTGDIRNYARAVARMVKAVEEGKPVLIHCAAGAQRTGGVIAAYRMLVQKKPPSFAYKEMQEYDWDPEDNPALPQYLNRHMAELARLLVEMKVIDRIPEPLPVLAP
jgi:hypothetical protein